MKSSPHAPEATEISADESLQPFNHRMKYMQLAEHINHQIETDQLHVNDRLPSLKQLEEQLGMSKETVLKGLNYLSEKGIIESVYRKGYYVRRKAQHHPYRIFFLLDKMNILRDRIYYSFLNTIKDFADVDVFFHHHNFKVFEKLILENLNNYTHFVITTFLREDPSALLNQIPPHKRIIIDYDEKNLSGDYTSIYQDFKSNIYDSLVELLPRLKKYNQLILIAPEEAYHAHAVIAGFKLFCKEYKFKNKISHTVEEEAFEKGNVYITFGRYDLDDVSIIKLSRKNNWKLGKDIGLLSYNDTAVKEVLENGITVISTDFDKMGEEAAKSIIEKKIIRMRDPSKVILRNSL